MMGEVEGEGVLLRGQDIRNATINTCLMLHHTAPRLEYKLACVRAQVVYSRTFIM
jgi:hypothetical protein